MVRSYAYIDGESHFLRSEKAWQALHGCDAALSDVSYRPELGNHDILVEPKAKVFWTRKMGAGMDRVHYFSAYYCDHASMHNLNRRLRNLDVDSQVIQESKQLADRRTNVLTSLQLIEKAKTVDVALVVRLLNDAFLDAFDRCHIYTSDVDFLPAIHYVRSRGKQVFVHGFSNGLGRNSELLTVPDRFVDLQETLRTEFQFIAKAREDA